MTKFRGREKQTRRKGYCSAANIENFGQQDEFAEHKCDCERHAATWLVTRSRNGQKLLQEAAQEMLQHRGEMYWLAIEPAKWSRSCQRLRCKNGG